MNATCEFTSRGLAFLRRNEKFVDPEIVFCLAANGNIERFKNSEVEFLARFNITNNKLDVVDQTTAVHFVDFHGKLSSV
ncbi:hypothetical protein D3C87_1981980 [compost metagenome]